MDYMLRMKEKLIVTEKRQLVDYDFGKLLSCFTNNILAIGGYGVSKFTKLGIRRSSTSIGKVWVIIITSGQSNLTKGRIAVAHGWYSIYCTMGRPFPSSSPSPSYGDLDPYLTHGPWAHPSPQSKQHLDRFSRFCRTHHRARQTDRQTTLLHL